MSERNYPTAKNSSLILHDLFDFLYPNVTPSFDNHRYFVEYLIWSLKVKNDRGAICNT